MHSQPMDNRYQDQETMTSRDSQPIEQEEKLRLRKHDK